MCVVGQSPVDARQARVKRQRVSGKRVRLLVTRHPLNSLCQTILLNSVISGPRRNRFKGEALSGLCAGIRVIAWTLVSVMESTLTQDTGHAK